MDTDVAVAEFRMDQRRARPHRALGVCDDRQVLVLNVNVPECLRSQLLALGHDQRNLVTYKAHHVRPWIARTRPAQHGLVRLLQPVLIDGYVLRGEDGHDPRTRLRPGGAQPENARVGALGEQNLHVQHPRHGEIAGEERLSPHLGLRIHPGHRLADHPRFSGHAHLSLRPPC